MSALSKHDNKVQTNPIVLAHSSKVFEQTNLNLTFLDIWDERLNVLVSEIRQITDRRAVLKAYLSILTTIAIKLLDPLQMTAFQILVNAVMDRLLSLYPKNVPITELIDEISDVHLNFVETLTSQISSNAEDDTE